MHACQVEEIPLSIIQPSFMSTRPTPFEINEPSFLTFVVGFYLFSLDYTKIWIFAVKETVPQIWLVHHYKIWWQTVTITQLPFI